MYETKDKNILVEFISSVPCIHFQITMNVFLVLITVMLTRHVQIPLDLLLALVILDTLETE